MWGSPSVFMSFLPLANDKLLPVCPAPHVEYLHVTVQWLASCSLRMLGVKGTEGHVAVGGGTGS